MRPPLVKGGQGRLGRRIRRETEVLLGIWFVAALATLLALAIFS